MYKSTILINLIDRVMRNLKTGMSPQDAVNDVAKKHGISKDGEVYKYLLKRAEEESATVGSWQLLPGRSKEDVQRVLVC